jgi:hypothetical protein
MKVSSPCPESWAGMAGDDKVRFCRRCSLNVYNLAAMKPHEIEALVRKTSGRLCGRIYVRQDRTATLRDCGSSRAKSRVRRAVAVSIILLLAGFSWMLRSAIKEPNRSMHPQWVQTVLNWIEPEQDRGRGMIMGKMVCPTPPTPPPTPPPPQETP